MSERIGVHISDGTTQDQRLSPALEDGYVQVDEMPFEELISLCVKFSSHVHFYNLRHERDGRWDAVFNADEAVIMAGMLSMDLKRRERDIRRRMAVQVEEGVAAVFECVREMNTWLISLKVSRHGAGVALSEKIQEVIQEKLAGPVNDLVHGVESVMPGGVSGGGLNPADLDVSWRLAGTRRETAGAESTTRPPRPADVRPLVWTVGRALLHAMAYFQTIIPSFLEETLRSGTHSPAVGLLIAFARLFARAQKRINTFTQRHRDFYYQGVLHAMPLDYVPDAAHLVLEADPGGKEVFVPRGTEFSAGKDSNGKELIYVADANVVVTDARIHSLMTLYFERDQLISPEKELHAITHAYVRRIPAATLEDGADSAPPWPLFGAGGQEASHLPEEHAEFGFGIASMVLLLKEGQRTIEVALNMVDPADDDSAIALARRTYEEETHDEPTGPARNFLTQAFHRLLLIYPSLLPDDERGRSGDIAEALATRIPAPEGIALAQDRSPFALLNALLIELVRRAASPDQFSRVFGKMVSRTALSCQGWLTPEKKAVILEIAERLLTPHSFQQVSELLAHDQASLSDRLLGNLFTVHLTAETGWLGVRTCAWLPLRDEATSGPSGLKLRIVLGPDVEAIVPYAEERHGAGWHTRLPLLVCRVNPQSPVYPYSLFEGLIFGDIQIDTTVNGATNLRIYNNEGPIDSSKPFQLFGAFPTRNSYCLIGHYELAHKIPTSLQLTIEWGDLPPTPGGFREYYRGYPTAYSNERFRADISVLQDGQWQPTGEAEPCRTRLFDTEFSGGRVNPHRTISIPHVHYCRMIPPWMSEEEFDYSRQTRNGFFKLHVREPESVFGHREYPTLLTAVLTENAKSKHPKPVPNPPYTPLVNRISLDYTARSTIQVGLNGSQETSLFRECVIPIHPFGREINFPAGADRLPYVLPQYPYDGNLFIGIASQRLRGIVTLLFHLQPDSTQTPPTDQPEFAWFYLASNRWHRLEPSRLLSDTTNGFLSSGIITLDVPTTINRDNTILPNEVYWLRVSARTHLDAVCRCAGMYMHGLKVLWSNRGNDLDHLTHRLPAGRIRQTLVSIPRLRTIVQIGESFGGTLSETTREMNTRMSERLRHKYRVSNPWDYERMILERFPEIMKVKCFPTMQSGRREMRPGHILIVVVPQVNEGAVTQPFGPMVNAVLLKRIHTTVRTLASPFVTIEVRNPTYEWIQVRCTLVLRPGTHRGLVVNAVNQAIVKFLSPWNAGGYAARFGWRVSHEDVESMIRELPDVEFVTNFSMLHITRDEKGKFCLEDTARMFTEQTGAPPAITPAYPWSLALPMEEHFLETTTGMKAVPAEKTGIDELEIGRTFIVA